MRVWEENGGRVQRFMNETAFENFIKTAERKPRNLKRKPTKEHDRTRHIRPTVVLSEKRHDAERRRGSPARNGRPFVIDAIFYPTPFEMNLGTYLKWERGDIDSQSARTTVRPPARTAR